jgi:hypothetical protein
VGSETGKNATFDVPPPGVGLETVMEAVDAVAMLEPGTVAVNFEPLTKVVLRALPFHWITEPETNPVPFTVSVKVGPLGAIALGTKG